MPLRTSVISAVLLTAATAAALACAPAPPHGVRVGVAEESAIILWDAATHTQHFIRRATFATPAKDFGFLVPTPNYPTLAEAPDAAFDHLAGVTAPRVVTRHEYRPAIGLGCSAMAPLAATPDAAVRVLEQTTVGGYDAAVLAADDPAALNRWLGEHGYESRPALTAWLAPYTKAGWTVTAFKIAKSAADAARVGSAAVRMTFETERPFFPYREPEDQRDSSADRAARLLRVYFVTDGRFGGARDGGQTWPGATVWANALTPADVDRLFQSVQLPHASGPLWLTEFEDRSSPRPGTDDVYFSRSDDQTPIERPPVEHVEYTTFPDVCSLTIVAAVAAAFGVPVVRRLVARRPGDARNSGPSPNP